MFAPRERLWDHTNVEWLHDAFTGHPLTGGDDFMVKLKTQLESESPEVQKLAAEMLWLLFLFPRKLIGPSRKREIVTEVWSWTGTTLDPAHRLLSEPILAGVGNAGTAFNTQRDHELDALIAAVLHLQRRSTTYADEREVANLLDADSAVARRNVRHILLHLLFPEFFERIASATHKRAIAASFPEHLVGPVGSLGASGLLRTDEALFAIRRSLESKTGRQIDFYDDADLRARWDPQRDGTTVTPPEVNDFAWAGVSYAYELARGQVSGRHPDTVLLFAGYLLSTRAQLWSKSSRALYDRLIDRADGEHTFAALLRPYGITPMRPKRVSLTRGPVSSQVAAVLGEARALAHEVAVPGAGPEVSARHVLGALLRPGAGHPVQQALAANGYDLDDLRGVLIGTVASRDTNEHLDAWRRAMLEPPSASPARRISVHAGHVTDSPVGVDQLDITPDVNALCDVLAAREVKPPLALGLFGDWGTGKSFFMKQMEERIDFLADLSCKAVDRAYAEGVREPETVSAYCTHVVQVWFNAWHYMDSNLWASLAARVFEGLAEHLSDDEQETLFARLETSKGILADVVAEKEAAVATLEAVQVQRANAEFSLLATGRAAFAAALRQLRSDPVFDAKLRQAQDRLGVSDARDNLEATLQQARELNGLFARLCKVFERPTQASLGIGIVVLSLGVAYWLVYRLENLDALARVVTAAAAGLATLTAGLAALVHPLKRAVQVIEDVHTRVEREKTEPQRLKELKAQSELLRAEEAERAAQAQVQALQREIEGMKAGRRMQRFILERHSSGEYRKHLGIVNLIRNDFQMLSELLAPDAMTPARSAEARVANEPAGTDVGEIAGEGSPPGPLPRIDRILLYIDDLDRCPESRVVEVLQALHLLLAFPLFVVVVGVDSRWLLLSLEDHYSTLRGRGGRRKAPALRKGNAGLRGTDEAEWSPTPQNYLEKIFQIPFTLQPMKPEGFGKLVRSLLPERVEEDGAPPVPGGHHLDDPVEMEEIEEDELPPPEEPLEDPVAAAGESAPELDLAPERLHVEPWELEFVEKTAPAAFVATIAEAVYQPLSFLPRTAGWRTTRHVPGHSRRPGRPSGGRAAAGGPDRFPARSHAALPPHTGGAPLEEELLGARRRLAP